MSEICVRRAKVDDLPRYVECAALFHEASPMHGRVYFDAAGFSEFFLSSLDNDQVALFCAEKDGDLYGIVGVMTYGLYFSPKTKVAQELFWWADPSVRGKNVGAEMYKAIEDWARQQGAEQLFMIALADDHAESMAKLYQRAGFEPMELTFMKGL